MKIYSLIFGALLICSCVDGEKEVIDLREGDEMVEESVLREAQGASESEEQSESESESESESAFREPQGTKVSEWTYEVVFLSEKNWGYQLFQKGKMIINQTSIPSIQGIAGFDTQEKADRTARHIISKLEKGVFPPTVDKKELDSLKVLRD